MRTKLPAWILEGLEQAEKEKQKKAEKEFAAKKAADNEKEREKRREEKGLGKFVSLGFIGRILLSGVFRIRTAKTRRKIKLAPGKHHRRACQISTPNQHSLHNQE